MSYDYSLLKGKIIEVCGSFRNFAKQMGLSERTISLKLNNKVAFTQDDIEKARQVLNLKDKDIHLYFFTKTVQ